MPNPVISWPQDTDIALSLRIGAASIAMAGAVLTWRLSDSQGGTDTGAVIPPTAITLGESTAGNEYEVGRIELMSGYAVAPGSYWLSWRTSFGDGGIPAAWAGAIRVNVTASGPRAIDSPATPPDAQIWTVQPINIVTAGQPVVSIGGQYTVIYSGGVPTVSHADTTGRDAVDSHPQSAITGLVEALAGKVSSNDARLSDARAPTAHAASHAAGGDDEVSPAAIGAEAAGTAAAVVAGHLAAAPHLSAPANAATLAKIGEADGLPTWDTGLWPGGGGGGAIDSANLISDPVASGIIALDFAAARATVVTLAALSTAVFSAAGLSSGTHRRHTLTVTFAGAVSVSPWPVGWVWITAQPLALAATYTVELYADDGATIFAATIGRDPIPPSEIRRLYLPLNESNWDGQTFRDLGDFGNLSMLPNGFGAPPVMAWSNGLLFFGGSQWLAPTYWTNDSLALDGDFSVECVARATSITGVGVIVGQGRRTTINPYPWLLYRTGAQWGFAWNSTLIAGGAVDTGAEQIIRAARVGNTLTLQVDDIVVATATLSTIYNLRQAYSPAVGRQGYPDEYFTGYVGEITVRGGLL